MFCVTMYDGDKFVAEFPLRNKDIVEVKLGNNTYLWCEVTQTNIKENYILGTVTRDKRNLKKDRGVTVAFSSEQIVNFIPYARA